MPRARPRNTGLLHAEGLLRLGRGGHGLPPPPSFSKHDAILSISCVTPRWGPKTQLGLKWDFLPAQGHTD